MSNFTIHRDNSNVPFLRRELLPKLTVAQQDLIENAALVYGHLVAPREQLSASDFLGRMRTAAKRSECFLQMEQAILACCDDSDDRILAAPAP